MSHDHSHHDHPSARPGRRSLLKSGLGMALSASGTFALNLAHMGAVAAQTRGQDDYKALICLFMYGGNDQANTVIATSGDSWKNYHMLRGDSIALPDPGSNNGLLPISLSNAGDFGNQGSTFALHPSLLKAQELFSQKKLAIIANVGPLIEPIRRGEYRDHLKRYPERLFSHNDQQATWQTFSPEGSRAGWGGNMVDALAEAYNPSSPFFSAISTGNSAAAWLRGTHLSPYSIPLSGQIGFVQTERNLGAVRNNGAPLKDILTMTRGGDNLLAQTYAELYRRTLEYQSRMRGALIDDQDSRLLPVPNVRDGNYPNPLISQLRMVSRIIASRQNLGVRRQVFFISLSGFDTHGGQKPVQARLLNQVDQTFEHFAAQMERLGVSDQVTLFTASDFGRSMRSNGSGTDHGWGSHHFVLGGAVKGGAMYGTLPLFGIDQENDVNGRLVPKFSVEQYAASLGTWFGLSKHNLDEVLPNLKNFSSEAALHFMRI
ncbi:MAG: DUF1501 domain-containing protein [Lautropia sp.]|nr:DUF1501 domain-containing protein [Lautropia sp.]